MARFRIFRGLSSNLSNMKANNGCCYFTQDDGKFYIDIAGDGTTDAVIGQNRIQINANIIEQLANSRTIQLNGAVNSSAQYNGNNDIIFQTSLSNLNLDDYTELSGIDILWSNSAGQQTFSGQNITINNLNDYQLILVEVKSNTTSNSNPFQNESVVMRNSANVTGVVYHYWSTAAKAYQMYVRTITINSNNTINITNAQGVNGSTNNYFLIPQKIYGIKTIS